MIYDALAEIVVSLIPFDVSSVVGLMLWHYLDESGVHDPKTGKLVRLTLGGCVATTEAWAMFSLAWKSMLDEFEIPEFHMKDIQAWKGIYDFRLANGDRDWGKHNALMDRAVDLIIKHTDEILGFVSEPEPGKVDKAFEDAYESNIAKAVKEAAKDRWQSEKPLTMVFAKHQEFTATRIADYFKLWADAPGLLFGGVADPKSVLPLQAADFVAYEMRCYTRAEQPEEVRYCMKRLAREFGEKQKIKNGRFLVTHVPSPKRIS